MSNQVKATLDVLYVLRGDEYCSANAGVIKKIDEAILLLQSINDDDDNSDEGGQLCPLDILGKVINHLPTIVRLLESINS